MVAKTVQQFDCQLPQSGVLGQRIIFRMELLTGTVPVNNSLLTGTVPVNNLQLTGTILETYAVPDFSHDDR